MGTWNSVIKRIEKKRENFVKKGGSFDFSYMDVIKKNYPKKSEDGRPFYCKWCAKPMYIVGEMKSKGGILLSCDTDDCIGNVDTSEHIAKKKLKELGLDTKLNFSGRKAILDRMTNQHWMTKYTPP
jgi:hypothetical protein